jgi:glycosyltransferase involved in cell wall biosynthesis
VGAFSPFLGALEARTGGQGKQFRYEPLMRLFINSLAASAGGGLTYIRNLVPQLAATPGLRATLAIVPGLRGEFTASSNIDFLELEISTGRRFWFEQSRLPDLIRRTRADVLLSTGNFALRNSPVPQILLSRNSIYTSRDFYRDLLSRGKYRAWLDTRFRGLLAKRSITWADVSVAPSEAFARDLTRWTGRPVRAIYHGFDSQVFTRDSTPLDVSIKEKLKSAEGSLRLLFVSHYNYYRNFETLIRALPLLANRLPGRSVKLLLTCKLAAGENPGTYNPETAAKLVRQLGLGTTILELGSISYAQLHHLYRRADIYVTPAYTETFAHPLAEAMSCGLPIVASDIPVHQEICSDAALYFPRFSPEALADRIAEVASSTDTAKRLSANGLERVSVFNWRKHTDELLSLAHSLLRESQV